MSAQVGAAALLLVAASVSAEPPRSTSDRAPRSSNAIRIEGIHGDVPALDEWVAVTGRFVGGDGHVPALAATSVTPIAPPDEPYE